MELIRYNGRTFGSAGLNKKVWLEDGSGYSDGNVIGYSGVIK